MNTIIIGVLVFLARMIDVTMGTLRLKAMFRGDKLSASVIAFIEVVVYSLAAARAFELIHKPAVLFCYALGYSVGNLVGIYIDEKLSKGLIMMTVIIDKDGGLLAEKIREQGYAATMADGYGLKGNPKSQLNIIIPKTNYTSLKEFVLQENKKAYITLMEVSEASRAINEK